MGLYFEKEDKEILNEAVTPLQVVEYLGLPGQKIGPNISILCPASDHNDHSYGNCVVYDQGRKCRCFACQRSFTPLSILIEAGHYSFYEAMCILASMAHMTSLEYALYMNKQITVFTNQLSTRMAVAANHKDVQSSNESYMTQQSIETLQDTLDEVTVTKPSKEKDDSREAVMTAMETAIEHLKSYKSDLDEGKDISGYADEFQNDFNELTGLANLYNQ